MALTKNEEARALAALLQKRNTGVIDPAVPDLMARKLLGERLAAQDTSGELEITARGEHHLSRLRRLGALKQGRSSRRGSRR